VTEIATRVVPNGAWEQPLQPLVPGCPLVNKSHMGLWTLISSNSAAEAGITYHVDNEWKFESTTPPLDDTEMVWGMGIAAGNINDFD
jgi:hypothetical protein